MKMKDMAILGCLILLIINFLQFFNPRTETKIEVQKEYLKGQKEIVIDTLFKPVYLNKPIFIKADTVKIIDSVCYAKSNFKIEKDSASVSGVIEFSDSLFSFHNIEMRYPEIEKTVTRIDTVLEQITMTENPIFLQNPWFWSTLASVGVLILTLLGSLN